MTIALSPRQAEALRYVAAGYPRKQAQERIGISPRTLKQHLHMAYQKLGARDDAHAVAIALRNELI